MIKTTFSFILPLILLISLKAGATEQSQEISFRLPKYTIDYKINQDGSFTVERSFQIKILQEKALEDSKQLSFSYSTSIETAKVIDAYTRKANGKKINVPKNNYQLTVNGGKDSNTAIFSDRTTMTVVFPDVEVGDSVALHYRLTAKEPIFPNQFSIDEEFHKNTAYDDLQIKINAPASLKLTYAARELKEESNKVVNNRHIIVWSWKNVTPEVSRRWDYSVYNYDDNPGLLVSTFNSYNEIALAYGARAIPKASVTDRINKLADEIVKDKKTNDEIAHSLYDWVATNITFAGNCVGLGAVVPHDLNFILDNRIGDCKDHATLLQSLLASKGIESTQALINSGTSYKLPKVPVVSMVNHVINYIPSMNLFLDSTSSSTPFRMLPFSDQDKQVLLVGNYSETMRTPQQAVDTNEQVLKSLMKINADGSIQGNTAVSLRGIYATKARQGFRSYSKDQEKDIIQTSFNKNGAKADGSFTKEDPTALIDTFSYSGNYNVKGFFQFNKTGPITLAPIFFNFAPLSSFLTEIDEDNLQFDVACNSGKSVEEFTYEFPDEIEIISIPENMTISNKTLSYSASYKLEDNLLTIQRTFDDKTLGNICTPAVLKENNALVKKAWQNYKEQIIYKYSL
jgi:transglutaminase-like putative cysteine protease